MAQKKDRTGILEGNTDPSQHDPSERESELLGCLETKITDAKRSRASKESTWASSRSRAIAWS